MPYNKNLQRIEKILKWIFKIQDVLSEFSVQNLSDFEDNETCQLAISQLITNIHELVKKVDDDFYTCVPKFIKLRRRIKLSRNIASHDYESLDIDIIYKLLQSLTHIEIIEELEAIKNDIGSD